MNISLLTSLRSVIFRSHIVRATVIPRVTSHGKPCYHEERASRYHWDLCPPFAPEILDLCRWNQTIGERLFASIISTRF